MYKQAIILFLAVFCNVTMAQQCDPKKEYVIGVQAVDYSPHYNFVQTDKANFFGEFVNWLKTKTQCNISILALPIKRLKIEFEKSNNIDFIYPDNPNWHKQSDNTVQLNKRYFSSPLTLALGSTIVSQENENITLDDFNTLAFPRGFTPVAWYQYVKQYNINFVETTNAYAALKMLELKRVDGADIEFNVAQYLIKEHKMSAMVMAKHLPFSPTGFHLSTIKEKLLLEHISHLINKHQDEINHLKSKYNIVETISGHEQK